MKMYSFIIRNFLPSIGALLLLVAPIALYAVFSIWQIDIFKGTLSEKTSAVLTGMLLFISLYLFVIYRNINKRNRYEEVLESCSKLTLPALHIVPLSISNDFKENLQYATYVLSLATHQVVSLSVLSSPKPRNGRISESEDVAAKQIFKFMTSGSHVEQDFNFRRIISLQDDDEIAFAHYLEEQKKANSTYKRGRFDFRIYDLQTTGNGEKLVRFPNFLVVDSKYVFITFRQYEAQSKGLFFVDQDVASCLSSYFEYLWQHHTKAYT